MDTTETNLVVKHCDDFDVVSTETLTTTKTVNIIAATADGKRLAIPFVTLKACLMHRRTDTDVDPEFKRWLDTEKSLARWLDTIDVNDMCDKITQIEKEISAPASELMPKLFLDTGKILNMSLRHLSSATLDDIVRRPAYYRAIKIDCNDPDDTTGWLMPVPGGMGRMPQDLWDCFVFADRMNASFVAFKPYAPLYADIASELNIGDCPVCRDMPPDFVRGHVFSRKLRAITATRP